MLIVPVVRGRGAWLATITGIIGFAGVSTMPGLLMADFFDSAIGAAHGLEGHGQVHSALEGVSGIQAFVAPGIVGLSLALPLAMTSLWCAGLARWWDLPPPSPRWPPSSSRTQTWPGTVIATIFLGIVSLALAKATQPTRRTA